MQPIVIFMHISSTAVDGVFWEAYAEEDFNDPVVAIETLVVVIVIVM